MRLPVIKPITYISPTSLKQWNTCEYMVYLYRMAGLPYQTFKYSMAAAVGTAVEAFVAAYVSKERGDNPHVNLTNLLDKIEMDDGLSKDEAVDTGRMIALKLKDMGRLQYFLDAGEVIIGRELYRPDLGPAILGIVDFVVDGVPLDFKCRGWNKVQKVSAYKGWSRRYLSTGGVDTAAGQSIEFANEDWAAQLVFYNWLMKRDDNVYCIWEVDRFGDQDFKLAIHEGRISKVFSEELFAKIESMWEAINGLEINIAAPEYSNWKCNPFHSPCPMSERCFAYQDHLEEIA